MLGVEVGLVEAGAVDLGQKCAEPPRQAPPAGSVAVVAQVRPQIDSPRDLAHQQESAAVLILAGRDPLWTADVLPLERVEQARLAHRARHEPEAGQRVAQPHPKAHDVLALEKHGYLFAAGAERQALDVAIRVAADDRARQLQEVFGAEQARLAQQSAIVRLELDERPPPRAYEEERQREQTAADGSEREQEFQHFHDAIVLSGFLRSRSPSGPFAGADVLPQVAQALPPIDARLPIRRPPQPPRVAATPPDLRP